MENDDKKMAEKFAKDFNNGYLLSKHMPELMDKILKASNETSETIKAMALGKKQHQKEQMLEEMKHIRQSQEKKISRKR